MEYCPTSGTFSWLGTGRKDGFNQRAEGGQDLDPNPCAISNSKKAEAVRLYIHLLHQTDPYAHPHTQKRTAKSD